MYNQHAPKAIIDYATVAAFGKLQELSGAIGEEELPVSKVVESV